MTTNVRLCLSYDIKTVIYGRTRRRRTVFLTETKRCHERRDYIRRQLPSVM